MFQFGGSPLNFTFSRTKQRSVEGWNDEVRSVHLCLSWKRLQKVTDQLGNILKHHEKRQRVFARKHCKLLPLNIIRETVKRFLLVPFVPFVLFRTWAPPIIQDFKTFSSIIFCNCNVQTCVNVLFVKIKIYMYIYFPLFLSCPRDHTKQQQMLINSMPGQQLAVIYVLDTNIMSMCRLF